MSEHHCSHTPANFSKAFAIGVGLNVLFVATEAVFGITSHSLALLADAGHNLSDVFALLLAWAAAAVSQTAPTPQRTYGLRSTSILAALFNGILLLIALGGITWEAVRRFQSPTPVDGTTVIMVAAVGIVINTATALLFFSGRKGDLNIRGAFLHMAADAAVSAGVVVAGLVIVRTGWLWIDPVVSLGIVAVITIGTWSLLRDSLNLALHAVPPGIDALKVEEYLTRLPGITDIHDLHIWAMSTTETALTVHLVKPDRALDDSLLARVQAELSERFGINHVTIQCECGDAAHPCEQEPAHKV